MLMKRKFDISCQLDISRTHSRCHKGESPLIDDFLVAILLVHQDFHQPFLWSQWLDFNTIYEFTFIISFVNPLLHLKLFNQTYLQLHSNAGLQTKAAFNTIDWLKCHLH